MFNKTDGTIVVTDQNNADLENTPAIPHDASIRRIVEEREDKDLARALDRKSVV